MPSIGQHLFSTREAVAYLQRQHQRPITQIRVAQLFNQGRLNGKRVGNSIMVTRRSLDKWAEQRSRGYKKTSTGERKRKATIARLAREEDW